MLTINKLLNLLFRQSCSFRYIVYCSSHAKQLTGYFYHALCTSIYKPFCTTLLNTIGETVGVQFLFFFV